MSCLIWQVRGRAGGLSRRVRCAVAPVCFCRAQFSHLGVLFGGEPGDCPDHGGLGVSLAARAGHAQGRDAQLHSLSPIAPPPHRLAAPSCVLTSFPWMAVDLRESLVVPTPAPPARLLVVTPPSPLSSTPFLPSTPSCLDPWTGKDATNEFDDVGHSADAVEQLRHLRIGSVLATAAPTGPAGGTAAGAATASAPAAGWAAVPAVAGTGGSAVADPVAAAAAAGKDGAAAAASAAAAVAANGGKAAVGSGAVAKGGVAPSRAGDAMRALAATLAALAAVTAVMAARRYVATLYWQRKG